MIREFQIWSQNLNRTTFDHLFGQEMVENWENPVFDRFWPKMGQMLSDFNFETRYEILSSFLAYMTHFCYNNQILNFDPPLSLKNFKWPVRSIFSSNSKFSMSDSESASKKTYKWVVWPTH